MDTLELDIGDLARAINKYLARLQELSTGPINFSVDYYWSLFLDENLYNPYEEPQVHGLEQISDDIASVLELKETPTDEVVLLELHHIAGILQAIAQGKFTCS